MEGRKYTPATFKRLFPTHFSHRSASTLSYNTSIENALHDNKKQFMDACIHNYSDKILSPLMKDILFKGISFVPAPTKDHAKEIKEGLEQLDRKLEWRRERERQEETRATPMQKHPFIRKTQRNTHTHNHPNSFAHMNITTHNEIKDNLNEEERKELEKWMKDKEVTIKRADKGGGLVILDTVKYMEQMEEHLQNPITYAEIHTCPTKSITTDTDTLIDFLLRRHHIDDKTATYLRPPTRLRTPILYGLPKLHKIGIPLRPVVSAIDNPTDYLSRYITHFLQPLAQTVPAYISDSKDFKQHLSSIPPLPLHTFLVTADVTSLYTNIPQHEGIDTACAYITQHRHLLPHYAPNTHVFRIILHHILSHSHFTFNARHFIQTFGTAIGCRMAAPFATIYMHKHDLIITQSSFNISHYRRLIDDIFFIFSGTETELQQLQDWMNGLHETIKYRFSTSRTDIIFLDMTVYLDEDRTLRTTIHRKDDLRTSLLHFHSNHPLHTKTSLIYSQALRYNMLTDRDEDLQTQLHFLTKALLSKQYPLQLINKHIQAAASIPQHTLIHGQRTAKTFDKMTVTIPYSTQTQNIQQDLNRQARQRIDPIHEKDSPRTIFKRHKNLGDLLIHTKLDYEEVQMD